MSRKVNMLGIVLVLCLGFVVAGAAKVRINEIAWSGTKASWADEWIELHNLGSKPVSLKGWILSWGEVKVHLGGKKGNTGEARTTEIPPEGYFLLERSDDKTIPGISADLIYQGGLNNSGEVIELRNASGDIVDRITQKEGWVAGSDREGDPPYSSMAKINGGWENSDKSNQAKDSEGNPIVGSPGTRNGKKESK